MLKWNVYLYDFNNHRIKAYNIFEHTSFLEGCRKAAKKYGDDRDAFAEQVCKLLRYYFWSKCECEIVISSWPPTPRFEGQKVDIFDQVSLNFDIFIDWLWSNRNELKSSKQHPK